ncbi:cation-independent mannose-6-phosphate receptor isoform X2 [Hyalella azteca]|uniref:Autophagy-related protein 27 n=1 Tax=Hyalella azteca TaxID=294128 RepID=A0A8B7P0A2_HYAAZ|nr:cation-independent mannose-6-phosphate receptor isoform X2 [Hyalella azteca]
MKSREVFRTMILSCLVFIVCLTMVTDVGASDSKTKCTLTTDDHFYDLTSLAENDYWSVEDRVRYKDFNLNFYLSLCHPLRNTPPGSHCSDVGAGVCVVQISKNESLDLSDRIITVVNDNAGMVTDSSLQLTSEGWLEYKFTDGTPCEFHGTSANYTTSLNLLCPDAGKQESAGPLLMSNTACYLTFAWLTQAACPKILDNQKHLTCVDKFINSSEKLNLHSLHSSTFYNVSSILDGKQYQINICGAIETGSCGGKNATVCDVSNATNPVVISQLTRTDIDVMWDGPYFSLHYDKISDPADSSGTEKNVVIKFLCDRHAHNTTIYFIAGNSSHLYFYAKTSVVCSPEEHGCIIKDRKNQVFDLRPLHKKEENWEVLDRREDHRDVLYHLNLCGPVNPVGFYSCPPGNVGACQTSLNRQTAYNLGYITSDPVINSDGTITIIYTGGDACNQGKHTRSTRIILSCDKYEHEPVFLEESPTCELVFLWATPFACPKHVVESQTCQIQDPLYGFLYDLTPLRNSTQDYSAHDGLNDYHVNICGPVIEDYGSSILANASIVISKASSKTKISGGRSPGKLIFNDGTLTMEFSNGSQCQDGKTGSSRIIFLCDHEINDSSTGLTVFRNSDPCDSNFVWRTKHACPPHTVIDCSVTTSDGFLYDLNPLSLSNMNQEELNTKNDVRYVLNVCRSVVHSKDSRCAYDAAACLIDESHNNKSLNLGVVGKGPFVENGRLKIKYENGDKCNATHRYSTEIYFECDEENLYPYPSLATQENCKYIFEWKTRQACREKIEPSSFGNCSATDIFTNYQYDLSHLKIAKVYEVSKGDVSLLLNVCGPVIDSRCPDASSGSCVKNKSEKGYRSGGKANAELMVIPGTLTLRYTNGDTCSNGVNATTLISFFCGAEKTAEGPVLVSVDTESCTYYVNWHTELACEYRISCLAHGYDETIDLRPLIQHDSNYEVPVKDDEKFFINICRPLNHVHESTCIAGASTCHVTYHANGTSSSDSLGKPLTPPIYDHDGSVLIMYSLGSQCRQKPGLKYSTKIILLCDPSAGKGSPKFVTVTDDCQYKFEWRTIFVCPPASLTPKDTDNSSCQIRHEPGKANLDLSSLRKDRGYIVPFRGESYLVNVCGSVCGESGVCTDSTQISYGLSDLFQFKWDLGKLKLVYYGGESCASSLSGKRSSTIFFECDMSAGFGHPEADPLMEDLECMAAFTWKTNVTCLEAMYANTSENSEPTSTTKKPATTSLPRTTALPFITTLPSIDSNSTAAGAGAVSPAGSGGVSAGVAALITCVFVLALAGGIFYAVRSGLLHRLINRAKMSTATPRYSSRRGGMMLLDDSL